MIMRIIIITEPESRHDVASPTGLSAEQPDRALQTAEMFLVATLRLWAAPHRNPTETHPHWHQGFEAAGLEDTGTSAFDAFFRIVATAARRPLDVRCVRCAHLGEDEAWFLQLIRLLQRNHMMEAEAILATWLPPTASRAAMPYAAIVAAAMAGLACACPIGRTRRSTTTIILSPSGVRFPVSPWSTSNQHLRGCMTRPNQYCRRAAIAATSCWP